MRLIRLFSSALKIPKNATSVAPAAVKTVANRSQRKKKTTVLPCEAQFFSDDLAVLREDRESVNGRSSASNAGDHFESSAHRHNAVPNRHDSSDPTVLMRVSSNASLDCSPPSDDAKDANIAQSRVGAAMSELTTRR